MAAITTQYLSKNVSNEITLTPASSGLSDTILYTSDTIIKIVNDDASAHVITIPVVDAVCECGGSVVSITDIVEVIPAGETREFMVSPAYADLVAGGITVNYDNETSVSIAAYVG